MGYVDRLLAQNEQIVFATRQHWIVLAVPALINLVPALAIAGGAYLLTLALGPFALLILVLSLALGIRFLMRFLRWWNEQYIITNRRVIQTEGLINKEVIDSSLEKINDVKLNQSVWGRLLGYGDVEILTGSELGVNLLHRIGDPVRFKTVMLDQKEAMGDLDDFGARTERVLESAPPGAGDVPELIAELDELRKRGVLTDEEFDRKKQELLSKI